MKSVLLTIAALPLLICSCSNEQTTSQSSSGTDSSSGQPAVPETSFFDEQGLAFYPLADGSWAVHGGHSIFLDKIVIPAEFRGKPVTEILHNFSNENGNEGSYKSITLPSTIKKIGSYAFYSYEKPLRNFIFEGSVEQFSEIEFENTWLNMSMRDIPNLKFTFSNKQFLYSEAYEDLGIRINSKNYFNSDTYNAYVGVSSSAPSVQVFAKSIYPFLHDEYSGFAVVSANTSIISNELKPNSTGTTTVTATDGVRSATINVISSNAQALPDDIYTENEIIDFDGLPHIPTKPVHNVPSGAKVYWDDYGDGHSYNRFEQYFNSGTEPYLTAQTGIGASYYYAVIFKPGYMVKTIRMLMIINHANMNNYVLNMSQNNHFYIHLYLDAQDYENYYVQTFNDYEDLNTYARFDWVATGTYGGAYVDINLSQTYNGGYNSSTHEYGGHDVNITTNTAFRIMKKSDHTNYSRTYNSYPNELVEIYTPLANNEKAYHLFIDDSCLHQNYGYAYPTH